MVILKPLIPNLLPPKIMIPRANLRPGHIGETHLCKAIEYEPIGSHVEHLS